MRKRVLAGILAVIMAGSIMTGQEKKTGIISKRFQKIL